MRTLSKTTHETATSTERRRLLGLLGLLGGLGLLGLAGGLHRPIRQPRALSLREADFSRPHDLAG
jgi:hypothetical protein